MASKYYLVDMTTITIMVSEQSLFVDLHKTYTRLHALILNHK